MGGPNEEPVPLIRRLRQLLHHRVRIEPLVPHKCGTRQIQYVPAGDIEEIVSAQPHDPPTLYLKGRMQWVMPSREWRYFRERPQADSLGLGCGKPSAHNDPRVLSRSNKRSSRGDSAWSFRERTLSSKGSTTAGKLGWASLLGPHDEASLRIPCQLMEISRRTSHPLSPPAP